MVVDVVVVVVVGGGGGAGSAAEAVWVAAAALGRGERVRVRVRAWRAGGKGEGGGVPLSPVSVPVLRGEGGGLVSEEDGLAAGLADHAPRVEQVRGRRRGRRGGVVGVVGGLALLGDAAWGRAVRGAGGGRLGGGRTGRTAGCRGRARARGPRRGVWAGSGSGERRSAGHRARGLTWGPCCVGGWCRERAGRVATPIVCPFRLQVIPQHLPFVFPPPSIPSSHNISSITTVIPRTSPRTIIPRDTQRTSAKLTGSFPPQRLD